MSRKPLNTEARERRLEIGRRIELARTQVGLKKGELAEACGVSGATVTGWIQGVHAPSPESLVLISRATRQPASFFDVAGLADGDARAIFERELVRLVGAKIASEALELPPGELRERLSTALEADVSKLGTGVSAIANALSRVLTADELLAAIELVFTAAELGMVDELIVAQLRSAQTLAQRLGVDVDSVNKRAVRLVG